ncbi:MAG: molybdenum cofactor guanylyltransferase [Bacteroidetes bacterium]|nr:MAG: molybdenum cofactor guanylyltransferase [Bacteroidota bacterium]
MLPIVSPLYGLALAGGHSTRMKQDKGLMLYDGMPRREYCCAMISPYCEQVFISCREEQVTPSPYKFIVDEYRDIGPVSGIVSAMSSHPDVAWLVLACDLYNVTIEALLALVSQRDASKFATAFTNPSTHRPEPLCAIWEPASRKELIESVRRNQTGPSYLLESLDCKILSAPHSTMFDSVNTPEEFSTQ